MKKNFHLTIFALFLCLASCKEKDPCEDVFCSFGEECTDGKCDCEINDFAYLNWTMRCNDEYCGNFQTSPSFTLIINEINVSALTVFTTSEQNSNIRIQDQGELPYKVLLSSSNNQVIDSGTVRLAKCQSNELLVFY